MSILYVAITSHGFGHVTRTAALINQLLQVNPEILPIFVTTAPRWLIEKYVTGKFLYRPRSLDVGVIQADSLAIDLDATVQHLEELRSQADTIIRSEVDFIHLNRVRLVFADIPPLAASIAHAAGVPCWMAGNFGWDFIYEEYGSAFEGYVDWYRELYGQCDRLFRLPFHPRMDAFPHIEDVGLTGGTPSGSAEQVRDQLQLDGDRPTVLLTFGGMGIRNIPYDRLRAFPEWQFISLDRNAPDDLANLTQLDGELWRPVDVMPACDRVVVKPGYGTFSEAMRVGVPISSMTRTGFAEAELLLSGLQKMSPHQVLSMSQIFEEPWTWLKDEMTVAQQPEGLDLSGNEAIVSALHAAL